MQRYEISLITFSSTSAAASPAYKPPRIGSHASHSPLKLYAAFFVALVLNFIIKYTSV
jgi:hypothetical protein